MPLRLLGALVFALLLHERFRGSGGYRTAAYLPTVVPDVAYALLWLWILNPLYGPLNLLLGAIGAPQGRWLTDPLHAQWAVILMSLFTIGEGFLVALAISARASRASCTSSRRVESARPLYVFARVTLPLMAADPAAPALPRHDLQLPGQLRAGAA